MKNIFLLLLLIQIKVTAQIPELLFVKSIGVNGENSDIQSAFSIDLDSSNRVYSIFSGASTFNVGLLENEDIISSSNDQFAALVRFNDDQFDLGGFGFTSLSNMNCDDQGLMIFGTCNVNSNFNFSLSPPPIFVGLQQESQNFMCRYDFEGFPLWMNLCQQAIRDAALTNNEIIAGVTNCTDCQFTDGLGSVVNFGGTSSNAVLVSLDPNDGELISSKSFISDGVVSFYDLDYSKKLQEFSCAFEMQGETNLQWLGPSPLIVSAPVKKAVVSSYNSLLECTSFITNEPIGFEPEFNRCRNVVYDNEGNMFCLFMLSEGNYNLAISESVYSLSIDFPLSYVVLKVDPLKRLCWIKNLSTNGFSGTRNLYTDSSGFVYLSGAYNEQLVSAEDNVSLSSAFTPEAGFLASFSPEGVTTWIHSISINTNSTVYDIVVNRDRVMYAAGRFIAFGLDFDFNPDITVNLGPGNNYDPFIAKYQLPEITPDLFVSKRYEGVGVSEEGATDLIRLRLSRVPESTVSVELTPDEQINLGNGVGVPIILEFAADDSSILEQVVNISAFNDLVVEGLHSGLISISMNSADPAFNNLSENPIAVSIIDNDIISVDEINEFGFSMSPNPASNFIDITSTRNLEADASLDIIDMQGRKVHSQNMNSSVTRIEVSQLAIGSYTVVVNADNKVIWREGLLVK